MTDSTAPLLTERAWLAAQGLANGDRGRFSAAAKEALAKAKAEGMQFAEVASAVKAKAAKAARADKPAAAPKPKTVTVTAPSTPASPKAPTAGVDAKVVRAWAQKNGVPVGARGRIHPSVVSAFLAAGGTVEAVAKPTGGQARPVPSPLDMPKVRNVSQGYVLARHKDDKKGARKVLVGFGTCSKGHPVSHCPCSVPTAPASWGGEALSFTKPVV